MSGTYRGRRLVYGAGDELLDVVETRTVREAVRWARADVRAGERWHGAPVERVEVFRIAPGPEELVATVTPGGLS